MLLKFLSCMTESCGISTKISLKVLAAQGESSMEVWRSLFYCKNSKEISVYRCFLQVNDLDPVCCNSNCILVISYLK